MSRTENPRVPYFSSPPRFWKKKTPSLPTNLTNLSRSFDENLNLRLKSLFSGEISHPNAKKSSSPIITLSWLNLAVDLLSKTLSDAKSLISDLPDSGNWPEFYLDGSVKLLDLCNSISAEISRLQHSRLLIHFVTHLLDFSGGSAPSPAPEKLRKARDLLNDWHKGLSPENRRFTVDPAIIRQDLTRCLPFNSTPVGKLMFRTIYAVNAVTIFVTSILSAALYGSVDESAGFRASGEFLWVDAFNDLESVVWSEFKERVAGGGGSKGSIAELDDVASCVARVGAIIDEVGCFDGKEEREKLEGSVKELGRVELKFSDGLEGLLRGVNGLFDVVLCTRNVLLENFRVPPKKCIK